MTDPDLTPSGPDSSGPDGAAVSAAADVDANASVEETAETEQSFVRRHLPWLIGAGTALAVVLIALVISAFSGDDPVPAPDGSADSSAVAGEQPRSLAVPSIGLEASVVPISIASDGVLTPPPSPEVGWWKRSALPGDTSGQMLITGHTIHDGYGIMNRLGDVKPGAIVSVTNDEGTVEYRTTKVEVLSKQELADNAQQLFGQDRGDGRLVLVTCDDFVGGEYLSNIVLFATPVDGASTSDGASDTADAMAR